MVGDRHCDVVDRLDRAPCILQDRKRQASKRASSLAFVQRILRLQDHLCFFPAGLAVVILTPLPEHQQLASLSAALLYSCTMCL